LRRESGFGSTAAVLCTFLAFHHGTSPWSSTDCGGWGFGSRRVVSCPPSSTHSPSSSGTGSLSLAAILKEYRPLGQTTIPTERSRSVRPFSITGPVCRRPEQQAAVLDTGPGRCPRLARGHRERATLPHAGVKRTGRCSLIGQPQNEEMQQTKPAFSSDCAGFAADLRCSADISGLVARLGLARGRPDRRGRLSLRLGWS